LKSKLNIILNKYAVQEKILKKQAAFSMTAPKQTRFKLLVRPG